MVNVNLHLPEGINYECTSCGICCSGWAVPMTDTDYERISEVDWANENPHYTGKQLFRQLKPYESEGTPYSHKIVSDTGVCPFLVNNLCLMHSLHGSAFKPSICQLFPYCFTETPSGVYATVSFVSMGVLQNAGKPLAEQREWIETKWNEFKRLYPDYHPDWSHTKLTVDEPISWDEYLKHEEVLLGMLKDDSVSFEERLLRGSAYLVSQRKTAPAGESAKTQVAGVNPSPSEPLLKKGLKLNSLDKHLLATFHQMYFPHKTLKRGDGDFNPGRFMWQRFFGSTKLKFPTKAFSIDELADIAWPDDDPVVDNMMYRYVFSHIYGKKYFGAGFGQVSVIGGYHHLILICALVKLHAKGIARLRHSPIVGNLDVMASLRQLERQLGETKLTGYGAAAWETMLYSPTRAQRLLSVC